MANTIASDILRAQIEELRQRLQQVERERDQFRHRALQHAEQHRAYRVLARDCQATVATLREQARRHELRIAGIETHLQRMGRAGEGRIAFLRPPHGVTRPAR